MRFVKGDAEKALRIIDAYIEKNLKVPVIVEGAKDSEALRELGFKGKIIIFNSGLTVVAFCEELSYRESRLIILVDFDRTGSILRKRLSSLLSASIQEVDTDLWEYIRGHFPIRTVEELPSIIGLVGKEVQGNHGTRKAPRNKVK